MPFLPVASAARFESPIEKLMGDELRYHGLSVWPQYRVGIFRMDMMVSGRLSNHAIIVECDGAIWHVEPLFDDFRDDILTEAGWEVIRFRGSDIMRCIERCALNIIDLYFPELREQISYSEVNSDLERDRTALMGEPIRNGQDEPLWYKRAEGNRIWLPGHPMPIIDTHRPFRDAIRDSLESKHYTLKVMVKEFILRHYNRPEKYLHALSEKGIL